MQLSSCSHDPKYVPKLTFSFLIGRFDKLIFQFAIIFHLSKKYIASQHKSQATQLLDYCYFYCSSLHWGKPHSFFIIIVIIVGVSLFLL